MPLASFSHALTDTPVFVSAGPSLVSLSYSKSLDLTGLVMGKVFLACLTHQGQFFFYRDPEQENFFLLNPGKCLQKPAIRVQWNSELKLLK